MAKFSDLGIKTHYRIVGKSIDWNEVFDRRILVEKTIIKTSKFTGKNTSGMCMQMQIVLATFNETPDSRGDYYVKDAKGEAVGERRSLFTGSDVLIEQIQEIEKHDAETGETSFPLDTTIVRRGKCYQFT